MSHRNLLSYWVILYEKRWWILLVALASAGSALFLSTVFTPIYQAWTTFYLPEDTRQPAYLGDTADAFASRQILPPRDEDAARPYIGMIKSRTLAERVNAEFPSKKITKLMFCDIDAEFTDEFMIRLYSRDRDPKVAAGVANSYIRNLNDLIVEISKRALALQREQLTAATAATAERVRAAEGKLKAFEEQHTISSLARESDSLSAAKTDFIAKLEDTRVSLAQTTERRTALQARLAEEQTVMAGSAPMLETTVTARLRDRLTDLATELTAKQVELGDAHLDLQVLRAEYKQVRAELENERARMLAAQAKPADTQFEALRRQLAQALVDADVLAAAEKGYEQTLQRIDERLARFPSLRAEHAGLSEDVARLKEVAAALAKDFEEVELQLAQKGHTLVLVDEAATPTRPAFPMFWMNGIFGLLAGLPLGIVFAFMLESVEANRHASLRKVIRALRAKGP